MNTFLGTAAVGIIVIIFGIMNMRGNISTLHRYHRNRVSEEDRIPFGKKVGLGTIIVGCAVICKACLQFAAEKGGTASLDTLGTVLLVIGLALGFAFIIYAMIKYNKGIF